MSRDDHPYSDEPLTDPSPPPPEDHENRGDESGREDDRQRLRRGKTCRPFDPQRMQRQLSLEAGLRWGVVGLFVAVFVATSMVQTALGGISGLAIVIVLGAWILMSMSGARVAQQLQRATALIDSEPALAEDVLARAMGRWPLPKSLRLTLYHRLAALRHRQRRYAETAAICHALLAEDARSLRSSRPHLLLMQAESMMQLGHVTAAWPALYQLSRLKLRMVESLQYLALKTQYEVASGYASEALRDLPVKLRMTELLPSTQAGGLHLLFAEAAERARRPKLERWLRDRAALLCSTKQLDAIGAQTIVSSVAEPSALEADDAIG